MEKNEYDKVNNLNSASMIDLKAELFRKQEEFKVQKLQSQNLGFVKGKTSTSNKKPSVFSKKNAGVTKRAEKDYEEKVEEDNVFERSKKALESKARLYEKISSGAEVPEEDGSILYLVDFQKKVIDDVQEKIEKERREKEEQERKEAEEEIRLLQVPVPAALSENDEWVDFVDSFGRSRRCMRKDLSELQQRDLAAQETKREKIETMPTLLSEDMRREIERGKWEKKEEEIMQAEKEGPIHYADVQHNEIRTHGVGFYKFDKDEDARQEQMDELLKMRQQTKDERSKRDRIKEKRKAALAVRLAKVKQRKKARMGVEGIDSEDDKGESDEEIGPKISEANLTKVEPEPLIRDDTWRQTSTTTREWDKGKERITERSEQVWLEKQRSEREQDFAPPSFYFESDQKPRKGFANKNVIKKIKQEPIFKISDHPSPNTEKSVSYDYKYKSAQTKTNFGGIQAIIQKKIHNLRDISADTSDDIKQEDQINTCEDITTPYNLSLFSAPPPPPPPTNDSLPTGNQQAPSTNTNQPGSFSVPYQSFHQSHFENFPPPNFNTPTPNINIPPPTLNVPPPNFNVPPPNFSELQTQMNGPTPNMVPAAPVQIPPPSTTAVSLSQISTPAINLESSDNQTGQKIDLLTNTTALPKTKFVPKMSVIDTRLMQNEDD